MKTISQVAGLTGISTRTLQYYDEIGLLKPSETTAKGYRLYGDEALERLQQILFFKELDFKLKEIKEILRTPDFDKLSAYRNQKKLLTLKRDRLDKLIALLEKLERGEPYMNFEAFNLNEYIDALEQFKRENAEEVVKYWGSVEDFDQFINRVRDDQDNVARLAVKQFGSVEKYTEAMKQNLAHFPELMEKAKKVQENKDDILKRSDDLFWKLTADRSKSPASPEVQEILQELMDFTRETSARWSGDLGEGYWDMVLEGYGNELIRNVTDQKFGEGAADYAAEALRAYLKK